MESSEANDQERLLYQVKVRGGKLKEVWITDKEGRVRAFENSL